MSDNLHIYWEIHFHVAEWLWHQICYSVVSQTFCLLLLFIVVFFFLDAKKRDGKGDVWTKNYCDLFACCCLKHLRKNKAVDECILHFIKIIYIFWCILQMVCTSTTFYGHLMRGLILHYISFWFIVIFDFKNWILIDKITSQCFQQVFKFRSFIQFTYIWKQLCLGLFTVKFNVFYPRVHFENV